MDVTEYNAHHATVDTDAGTVGYAEFGDPDAPGAVFVHGVFVNGLLWRNVIADAEAERRCIAVDLPAHGRTRAKPGREYTLPAHAEFVEMFADAIGLDRFDLVGNDTGGAVCQHVAVRSTDRVRSLTLTNCDTPGNFPPEAFAPTLELARSGGFPALAEQLLADFDFARQVLSTAYEHPERVTDDVIRAYFEPALESREAVDELVRFMTEFRDDEMDLIEPALKGLEVPTLLVWGTGDDFFDVSWAHRLRETLPNVADLVEVPGAKLFFPDERAAELTPHLLRHWKESDR